MNPTTDRRNKQYNCIQITLSANNFVTAVDDVSHGSPATAAQCIAGRGYNPLKMIVSRHALHYAAADRLQTE